MSLNVSSGNERLKSVIMGRSFTKEMLISCEMESFVPSSSVTNKVTVNVPFVE